MTAPRTERHPQITEPLELGLTLQCEGLKLLLAEMQALAALMPGHHQPATEDEVEAGFDDMPV